jgi:CheY-like chemotaxis protein
MLHTLSAGERHVMPARDSDRSELRAQVEWLRRELDRAHCVAHGAEEQIQRLVRERDTLALSNLELSRRVEVEITGRAAMGQFAGRIAHDFNNLLAVIAGGLELLARADRPERRARLLKRIDNAVWRGGDLTRRLQEFARQSGEAALSGDRAGEGSAGSVLLHRVAGLPMAPKQLSVLIVEDDDEMAALVADMLERLGHRGLRVSTLAAAIAVLSGGQGVDLIFADVLLAGGGSGLDLAREITRRRLGLPIVLTSGFGSGMRGRLEAARLPFLPKPYTLTALEQVLQQAAQPPGPEVAVPS